MARPPRISPAEWMDMTDAQRARWEEWETLSDEERAQRRVEADTAAAHGEAWEDLSEGERAEADAAERSDLGASKVAADGPAGPTEVEMLDRILHELENIRFRLGVLVFFIVILPFVVGLIVGLTAGLTN
jgi:hypothetical protein